MTSFLSDVHYAIRTLAKSRGFTAVAVATLALGIGANTAIFSVVRGVLWTSLPYRDVDSLVRIGHVRKESTRGGSTFSPQDFEDLERTAPGLARAAAYEYMPGLSALTLLGHGNPQRLPAAFVSPRFFETLGLLPERGRWLRVDENTPGRDAVAVVSHRLWATALGADRGAVGGTILLEGRPFTIAGVMPPAFQFPAPEVDFWVPVSLRGEDSVPHQRGVRWLAVVGRLRPGSSPDSARAGLDSLFQRLERQFPESNKGFGKALVVPLERTLLGEVRRPLLVLLAAVGLLLLLACANVANLLLARSEARGREIAIRTALGARPGRLVRLLLTESVILSLAGGALGLLLAQWGVDALLALTAGRIPRAEQIRPDAAVAGFSLAISVVTGILFGLLPAFKALRVEVLPAMESGGRGAAGSRRDMRRGLVVAETVLAVLLLTGAGLLAKSFWRLIHVSSGLSPERTLSVWLPIPDWKYPDEKADHYRDRLLARLRTVPGVTAVGASKTMPLAGGGEAYVFQAEGPAATSEPFTPASGVVIVTPGYFAALGIPILRGRAFTEQDMTSSAPVLVANQTLARELWPGQEAVGKALRLGRTRFQVIGVAADVRNEGLPHRPGTAIYVPMSRFPRSSLRVFLRTARDPRSFAAAARTAIHDFEPDQPVSDLQPLSDVVDASVLRSRFYASTLGIFAGLALLLAGSGLYAVLSYQIARRTREIGVRMALGAGRREVLLLVAREGIGSSAAGILIGLLLSAVAGRLLGSLLFDVRPLDALVFALVPVFLLAVAAIASCAPALRAARVDPILALRSE